MNNSFGTLFRATTFGESHGPALGVIVDGVPSGIPVDEAFIQSELDRRRPGQSKVSTARKESDRCEILSGVFEGVTTGTPVAILLRNGDQHSSDYENIADLFRPGHADYTYFKKYGIRDYRGGGRSSGRETAARVAAGAVAKLFLRQYGISVRACASQIGKVKANPPFQWEEVEKNIVRAGDPASAEKMILAVKEAAANKDSIGGIVYGEILGLPPGLGEPVFDKFDALLGHAFLSIGGVKGVEVGDGFAVAEKRGSENNDEMDSSGFLSNHAGGILGGISNGNTVTFRLAVKPTPSIASPQKTVDIRGEETTLEIVGRHDPCLVPRIVPVAEAMAALVTADLLLRNRAAKAGRK
ncbi:MAG: chorismate synthase [Lentisphaeria bacterium]|nr:chorismate synthase [Lentisphaeria bacterium]